MKVATDNGSETEKGKWKEEVMRDQKHKAGEIWSKMLISKKRGTRDAFVDDGS